MKFQNETINEVRREIRERNWCGGYRPEATLPSYSSVEKLWKEDYAKRDL
jgi:hypothetical protein